MKKIIKIFSLSILIILLITNISYATTLVIEQLNLSLKKMFASDIKIEQFSSGETITMKGQDIEIQGEQIKLYEKDTKKTLNINYTIVDNICRFESHIPVEINANTTQEEAVNAFKLIMKQLANYDICYLSVANVLGVDLSLAYTYYSQNYNNETINTKNKVYNIETNLPQIDSNITSFDVFSIVLEVDCLELVKLNVNDVDKTNMYKVTVLTNGEGGVPPTENVGEDIKQEQFPTIDDLEQVLQTKKDDTTAKVEIPKAGKGAMFILVLLIIVIFAVIMYKKNKEYDGV